MYKRWDALFGGRQNISPTSSMEGDDEPEQYFTINEGNDEPGEAEESEEYPSASMDEQDDDKYESISPALTELAKKSATASREIGSASIVKKGKQDLSSAYSKARELQLEAAQLEKKRDREVALMRLEFDKDVASTERAMKERRLHLDEETSKIDLEVRKNASKDQTVKDAVVAMIASGKTNEEIETFVVMLKRIL